MIHPCFKKATFLRDSDKDYIQQKAQLHQKQGLSEAEALVQGFLDFQDEMLTSLEDAYEQLGIEQPKKVVAPGTSKITGEPTIMIGDQEYVATFGRENKFKTIGTNENGDLVGVDDNGVRGIMNKRGIIVTQPVGVIPGKGISVGAPEGEFLTTEEVAKKKDTPSGFFKEVDVTPVKTKKPDFEKGEGFPLGEPKVSDKNRKKKDAAVKELEDLLADEDLGLAKVASSSKDDSEKRTKITMAAANLVSAYLDDGVTRFKDIQKDIHDTYGEQTYQKLYDAVKAAYASARDLADDDLHGQMDTDTRKIKADDLIQEFKQAAEKDGPHTAVTKEIYDLIGTEKLDKRAIEKIGAKHGITDQNEVKELAELAVVQKARELAENNDFAGLVQLYEDQPNLTHRTNESIAKQQYSTPAPIAYMMGKYVGSGGKKLEPSAGNGMLTIVGYPKNYTVNEIDPVRQRNLRTQGFGEILNQDGSKDFGKDKQFDAVITNPPFGGVPAIDIDGYKFNELAQIMAVKGLDAMKDEGKAAIIIGGNSQYDEQGRLTGRDRIFFNYLYNQYNVEDVIDISGDVYRKQGASFPIRVILINGRKAVPQGIAPILTQRPAQEKDFEGIRERIQRRISNENLQPGQLEPGPTDPVRGGRPPVGESTEGTGTPKPANKPVPGDGPAGGQSRPAGPVRGRPAGGPGTSERPGSDRAGNSPQRPTTESTDGEGQPEPVSESQQPEGTEGTVRQQPPQRGRQVAEGAISAANVAYKPLSKGETLTLSVPGGMAQEVLDAQTDLENEVGNIDDFVQTKLGYKTKAELHNALSAEQIDGVALAIRNIERGTGLIIGDMTGVGKGRQAAAVIRYANQEGIVPIFLTEQASLFSDLWRDLAAIGSDNLKPFPINNYDATRFTAIIDPETNVEYFKAQPSSNPAWLKAIENRQPPVGTDVILSTYSQVQNPKNALRKINFLLNNAKGTILIMDEAHNASGEGNTGELFQQFLPETKGVVFLSGTFAKRADNMPVYATKTSMSEANMTREDLMDAVKHGGIALQEIIASNLVEAGEMVRRQRSLEGIEVRTHMLSADDPAAQAQQQKSADQVTSIMRDIIEFQREYVKPAVREWDDDVKGSGDIIDITAGTNMAGVDNTPYFSKVFNVTNQLLYAIKAKETARLVIEELRAGRKPFIAINNTMEAMLTDLMERGELTMDDVVDPDFRFVLKKGLEGVMRVTVKDPAGNSRPDVIPVDRLSAAGQDAYHGLVDKIKGLHTGLTISPIDELVEELEKAGIKVGEITGRKTKIRFKDGKAILQPRKKEQTTKLYQRYNSGELDVIIVNSAGSTGQSAHSSPKFKDQRQRSMVVLQPMLDISKLVQMLGRVNRTGQVSKPMYTFVTSSIPAETRLTMMTMRKLKSLDANTTSNQKQSKTMLEVPEILNKYGDQIVVEYLQENPELIEVFGDKLGMLKNENLEPNKTEGAAHDITGRVAILPVAEQIKFYNEVVERYQRTLDFLNEAGMNDLEVKQLPLNATPVTKEVKIVGKGGRSKFGSDTYLEQLEVDTLKKPLTKAEIDAHIQELTGGDANINQRYIEGADESLETRKEELTKKDTESTQNKIAAINKKEDLTDGEKEDRIRELEENEGIRLGGKIAKEETNVAKLKTLFNFFQPGRVMKIPSDLTNLGQSVDYADAVFMGFDINLKKAKPYLPSNITLKFALNDSRRMLSVPASKSDIINAIRESSYQLSESTKRDKRDNWDSLKKPKARTKRYFVTGNILQGMGDASLRGPIVKFTTKDGFIETGIMQPESFDPNKDVKKTISVPAVKATPIIVGAEVGTEFKSSDGHWTIRKEPNNAYRLSVPLAKQVGGKYFLDADINSFVDGGLWNSSGNVMWTRTDASRLPAIMEILTKKFGTSFDMDAKTVTDHLTKTDEADSAMAVGKTDVPQSPHQGKPTATGKGTPFNMASRLKEIFKKYNIPLNEKSLRQRFAGVYKYFTEGVRVQAMWDIYVAAHEGLHAFDNRHHIQDNVKKYGSQKLKSELTDAYENLYPSPKKTADMKERIKEGLAMVTQYYVADPIITSQRYPEVVKHLLTTGGQFFKEEVGNFVRDMQGLADDYFALKPQDKVAARIKFHGADSRRGVGFWTKVEGQLFNDLNTGEIVDNLVGGIYRASAITPHVAMLRNAGSMASNWIKHPFGVASKPQTFLGNGQYGPTQSGYRVFDYMKLLKSGNDLIEFNSLLIARRNYHDYLRLAEIQDELDELSTIPEDDQKYPAAQKKIAKLNAEYAKLAAILDNNRITLAEAAGTVKALEGKYQRHLNVYDGINADLVNFMEATGLVSHDKAEEFRAKEGYAAFQRYVEDEHLADVGSLNLTTTSKNSVKALKAYGGSALQIIPPVFSQMLAINETLIKGHRNLVWQAWAEAAATNKEVAQFFEQVTDKDVDPKGRDIQTVYVKGVRKYYKMGEEARLFGEALTPTQIDVVSDIARGFARIFQTGTTTAYPIFALVNMSLDAWVRAAQTKTGLIPIWHDVPTMGKAMLGMVDWMGNMSHDNEFANFMALGGRKSTYQAQQGIDADASLGTLLNKDWWSKTKHMGEILLQGAELPTNFTELIGRGTEYIRAVHRGHPTNVAMLMAANVSVNFANKGKFGGRVGAEMVKWVSYMGSSIQALHQYAKTVKNDPKRASMVMALATTIGGSAALLTYLLGDDDEKDMLANQPVSDYARWIYLPASAFGFKPGLIRFRVPEQIGVPLGWTQLYFAHQFRQQPLKFADMYKVLEAPLPQQVHLSQGPGVLMSSIPTAIAPEIQVLTNTRFYPELLPIVPPNMQDYAEWRQYDKYSSRAAKAVGDLTADNLKISPKKFDFYVRAKFGRATQLVQSLAEAAIFGDEVKTYIPMWQEYDRVGLTGRMYNQFWDIVANANRQAKSLDIRNTPGAVPRLFAEAKLKAALLNIKAKQLGMALDQISAGQELPAEKKRELYNMILQVVKEEEKEHE